MSLMSGTNVPATKTRGDWLGATATSLTVVAALLLLLPLAGLVLAGFRSDETGLLGLDNYRNILGARKLWRVIGNTALLGLGSLAIMYLITLPFAWLFARTDFAWRRGLLVVATAQIAIPGFLVALGYIFLLNPTNGIVNLWWRGIAGDSETLANIYSLSWIILLQGLSMVGPAFFFLAPAFASVDGSLEEAASVHGIGKFRAVIGILLPVLAPAVISTGLFFLVISIETFDYAGMLGMPARIDVVATWIYQFTQSSTTVPQFGQASALGTLIALVLLLLMIVQGAVFRKSSKIATVGGRKRDAAVKLQPIGQAIAKTAFLAYALVGLLLPFLMLVWTALLPLPQPPSVAALAKLSLDGFRGQFWVEIGNVGGKTLLLAIAVPTLVLAMTIAMSWSGRLTEWAARALDATVVASLAVPSLVVAIIFAMMGLALHSYVPLYGSTALLALAIATRYLSTTHRITNNAFRQVNSELIEAARISGIQRGRTLLHVMIPVVWPGLMFAWFWVALLALRELPITLILGGYDLQTLATRIFLFNSAGQARQAAALSIALFAIVGVFLAGFLALARRGGIAQFEDSGKK